MKIKNERALEQYFLSLDTDFNHLVIDYEGGLLSFEKLDYEPVFD